MPFFGNNGIMKTTIYSNKHNITYSNNTAEQCKNTNDPDSGTQNVHSLLLLQVLRKAIPYPNGTVVCCVKTVVCSNCLSIIFLECFVSLFRV